MTVSRETTPVRAKYWAVPVIRGIVALVTAAVITFSADHSSVVGLVSFGIFAILSGLVVGGLSLIWVAESVTRGFFVAIGVIGVIAGVLSLIVHSGGLGFFLFLVSVWAALTGFLELYSGLRTRGRSMIARDWLVGGALTAVLAVVFLLLPPNATVAVGLLGAYGVVLGIYLVIGGLSLKWGPSVPRVAASASVSTPATPIDDSETVK